MNLGYIELKIDLLKTLFLAICTFYTFLKISSYKDLDKKVTIKSFIFMFLIAVAVIVIKNISNPIIAATCLIFLLSTLFSIVFKSNFGYATLTTTISLSINYVLFFIAIIISYIINKIHIIKNDYINLLLIVIIQSLLLYRVLNIKRLKEMIIFI